MWPRADRQPSRLDFNASVVPGEYFEGYVTPEGPSVSVDIAPGLVRLRRVDHNRAEKARVRAQDRGARRRMIDDRLAAADLHTPMVWASVVDEAHGSSDGKRGAVVGWSRDSRARLVSSILELDLASFVARGTPCMVTLTLPGRWQEVAPTAAAAAAAFHRFDRAWRKHWGEPLRCIWKREFQRRGAPHWHLWTVLPEGVNGDEFRAWLSRAWTTALQVKDPTERALSLAAGTGLDFAEGLRASDPKRLAVYFLKESMGGEGKAYQNMPPEAWEGQSVGRYWGVRGLDKAVATVAVDPVDSVAIFRAMRRAREARGVTREVRVPRVSVDAATGEVRTRFRKVRRRVRVRSAAGWVAVNDGPAFGASLGRYAELLSSLRRTLELGANTDADNAVRML
jgi:hypothetical protein